MKINNINDLKVFIEKWAGKRKNHYGFSSKEIPFDLPKALKEIYEFAGNWPQQKIKTNKYLEKKSKIFQKQDYLYDINDLVRKNNRISFMRENQGNWGCQIEINNNQSPVYSNSMQLYGNSDKEYEIVCDSLEHFLITFCLQELVFGSNITGLVNQNSIDAVSYSKLSPI